MARHVLTVDGWHPYRLNQLIGVHWGTRSKRKRIDRAAVALAARIASVPPATGKRCVSLLLTMAPRQRRPDPDALWKSLLDALVRCGLLVDDGAAWCELGPVTFDRGPRRRTVVVLEDLAR